MKENVKISHYILCIVSFIWSSEIDGLIDSISIFSCRYDDCSFINPYYLARTLNSYHQSFILGGWYKKKHEQNYNGLVFEKSPLNDRWIHRFKVIPT